MAEPITKTIGGVTRTFKDMQEYIAFLENQANELAERNNRAIVFKVAEESGAVSAYGVQNIRPVTLYAQQWQRLAEAMTGKPLAADSPLGKFLTSAAKLTSLKDDDDATEKAKKQARLADISGMVSHPKPGNKATAAAA